MFTIIDRSPLMHVVFVLLNPSEVFPFLKFFLLTRCRLREYYILRLMCVMEVNGYL